MFTDCEKKLQQLEKEVEKCKKQILVEEEFESYCPVKMTCNHLLGTATFTIKNDKLNLEIYSFEGHQKVNFTFNICSCWDMFKLYFISRRECSSSAGVRRRSFEAHSISLEGYDE